MSLLLATFLTGLVLVICGLAVSSDNSALRSLIKGFPRSNTATYVLFGTACLWFLFRVWNLSMADFGEFRKILFLAFSALSILAFFYVPDFLAIRGLASLILLSADPLLAAGYGRYEGSLLVFKAVVYLLILAALWLGAQPYRLRNLIEWIQGSGTQGKIVGWVTAAAGLFILGTSFSY